MVAHPELTSQAPTSKRMGRRRRVRAAANPWDAATLALLVKWLEAPSLASLPRRVPEEDTDLFSAVSLIVAREAAMLEECRRETRRRLLAAELMLQGYQPPLQQ
ncbi:unnamed protein product [Symbiodinium pilosum]|uniref:Uncharacterized protein n=1 Tax=Symbiodinium pilosum TaxID=2952 RepID=A0A812QJQ2_SYMPI|nr:unnamed protein product [Symbiodinium pilosum]